MELTQNRSLKRRRSSSTTIHGDGDPLVIGKAETNSALPQTPTQKGRPRPKFIVGLDYGTTFSSVSYIKLSGAEGPNIFRGERIKSVYGWPNNTSNTWRNPDVPSECWYLEDELHWGYNARQNVKSIEDGKLNPRNRIVQFAKLLLVEEQADPTGPRAELRRTLYRLGKKDTDVIKDYIREILRHSKTHLEQKEGFKDDCEVELVLCVPAGWPAKAIRTMQIILLDVAQEIQFGRLAPLFILNEPEAAATHMLEALSGCEGLEEGDVFMVCDAGGGTVDTITYRVRREMPFRVDEVVSPSGSNCGSSYVNQALKRDVISRIKGTEYEALKGPSFEYIIEHDVMNHVEYSLKRLFDPADGLDGDEIMVVHGLKRDTRKGFGDSTLYIPRRQIPTFFERSLQGISSLIQQQIDAVSKKGLTVSKILLVGGFSGSPMLRQHIRENFDMLNILDCSGGDLATAVSHGAVFRALNKEDGPKRTIQSNFGFLQIEPYNPKLAGHRAAFPTYNNTDGKHYVYDVLDWIIKKGQVLKASQPFRTRNYQTFKQGEDLVIRQRIYVFDKDNVRDHYEIDHKHNKGAESHGLFEVDIQQVEDESLLEAKEGPEGDYYEVHYDLIMEVDGRNLTVKLFCPPGGKCRGHKQFCIAAAFTPGAE